jgi:hypothetical protein
MNKWLVPIAASVLCLSASAAVSLTGIVGDEMCAGDHKKMGGTDSAKCMAECVKEMGAKYALIVGGDAYVLSDQAAAAKFAGKKATVTGEVTSVTTGNMTEKTLTVKSIVPAK